MQISILVYLRDFLVWQDLANYAIKANLPAQPEFRKNLQLQKLHIFLG